MQITQSLRLQSPEVIAFVGAGGKSTTLFRLADEFAARGQRVIVTTTTQFGKDQVFVGAIHESPLRYEPSSQFLARVHATLQEHSRVLIIGADVAENKVAGVPPEFIDQLAALEQVDAILYEADGARRLPFKAPAAHEPVIAPSTTLLVPVVGANVFARPLDDSNVQRAELVAQLAGARIGEPVTPGLITRVLAHSNGGLKNKPPRARVIALVNQVETDSHLRAARELAQRLLAYREIGAVAIGATQTGNPIRETHRRVAAIILAAGASARMGGRIKQLLPWRGKTLVENAIASAAPANVTETLVVLGAHAEMIRPLVEKSPARVVLNRNWEGGQATSIRAGLNALASEIDAAIFINADQPWLTRDVVDAIAQRYRETDAAMIAAEYAGRRGSPVLFDRKYFGELANLEGERGGRELLAKYHVERVEFADARLGIDVDTLDEYEKLTH